MTEKHETENICINHRNSSAGDSACVTDPVIPGTAADADPAGNQAEAVFSEIAPAASLSGTTDAGISGNAACAGDAGNTSRTALSSFWQDSVYSDGSPLFVSDQAPAIGEKVVIRLRLLAEAPVSRIFVRYIADGTQRLAQMQRQQTVNGLDWYAAEIPMTEKQLRYQFYLTGAHEEIVYCYTQKGLTPYLQGETFDFVLLSDYVQPEWVKSAVFYQIFPERFCQGNPENHVRDGEIELNGHVSQQIRDWNQEPQRYEQSYCMDYYGGDLDGIRKKIPYLKELGVTALYLNPIFWAPTVHKYDCIDYEKVDPHFGGDQALAELSRALHAEGMRLILDISVNHTGTDHKWFNKGGTYFDRSCGAYNNPDAPERSYYFIHEDNSYMGWLGHANMPELNYQNPSLREKIYAGEDSILKKWLKPPYSIDGWRFDVADVMAKYGPVQLAHQVWKDIRRELRSVNPQAYLLAEEWNDCSEYLQGEEWDAPMNYYGCARIWRSFIGMSDPALDVTGVLAGIHCRIPAETVKERLTGFFGRLPFALQQNQFNLLDSHDVSRLHCEDGLNMDDYRGAVIAQFTMLGAPCVYYGDEAAIGGYTDSLEGCRYPMPWGSGFEQGEQYALYHSLMQLRQQHRAFADGTFQILYAKGQTIAFARQTEEECWLSVISSADEDAWITLPLGILGVTAPIKMEGETVQKEKKDVTALTEMPVRDALGRPYEMKKAAEGVWKMRVRAHESYLLACK